MPIAVTDETFDEEVLDSDIPVLVDFWAPWCGPCKAIAPALEKLAEEHEGKLKVVKVDVQAHIGPAKDFGVQNIPTFILFEDGEPIERKTGTAGGLAGLKAMVEPYLEE